MNYKDFTAEEEYLCRAIIRNFKYANNLTFVTIEDMIIEDIIYDELLQSIKKYDRYNFNIIHNIFKELNILSLYKIYKGFIFGNCIKDTFYAKFEWYCVNMSY